MRTLMHALVLSAVALSVMVARVEAQSPEEVIATIREAATRHGVSGDRLVALGRCESTLNPAAVGRAGEQGLFQLLPAGLGRTFRTMGYADPFDAWEASDFTAWAFAHGFARHWSCAR